MNIALAYPQDHEVKVEWKFFRVAVVIISLVTIWPLFIIFNDFDACFINKLLILIGLNIDIVGVVVASRKTPFYGHFYDCGRIEIVRANVERKSFQMGMCLIALGFLLQALGTLYG